MSVIDEIYSYDVLVNSLQVKASYYKNNIEEIFFPLLKKLTKMKEEKKGKRLIIYLVASPGVGKSTLASFLEYLSNENDVLEDIQAIGIDGFHYKQEYIKNNTITIDGKEILMKDVKGCPETFNLEELKEKIKELQIRDVNWPIYDRKLHDVSENELFVDKNIVIIEGNWLLQNEDGWRDLKQYCDYSIFIECDESILKNRLIDRKVKGGLPLKEANEFYERSDKKNIKRVVINHLSADLNLHLNEKEKYFIGGIENVKETD